MSKELEAFENIKREAGTPYFSTLYDIAMWKEDLATIEKALKSLDVLKKYVSIGKTAGGDYIIETNEDDNLMEKEEYEIVAEVFDNE